MAAGAAAMAHSSAGRGVALPEAPSTEPPPWRHGIALLGDLKYPAGFPHFNYVNAEAPPGGTVREAVVGTYDSFNMVVAGVKGNLVEGISLIYDTLMMASLDEIASEYGLIAEAARYPQDLSWVSFRLRPGASWHDGRPISPEDVIYSLQMFKQLHPQLAAYYRHVLRADKVGKHEVRFEFDTPGIRELPQIVGQLTVLPKHWWEGKDASGKRRDISQTVLEPPLGSGPYASRASMPDALSYMSASPTTGATLCRSTSEPTIFASSDSIISGIRALRSRLSGPARSTGGSRTSPRTGRPAMAFRRSSTNGWCLRSFRFAALEPCRHSHSTSADASSMTRE